MATKSDTDESDQINALPPIITTNPRAKIEICNVDIIPNTTETIHDYSDVSLEDILPPCKEKAQISEPLVQFPSRKSSGPRPLHSLTITWSPSDLYFEIDEKEVIRRLWVWNSCSRSIYLHCCGFWDDTARLGAGWRCYPRTRFRLAPGMKGEVFVKAVPRNHSPVPQAFARLQLAAAHMRDCVTGYFVVPIQAIFLNYVPPYTEEGE